MSERAKAKQIQVEASGASTAGTLQELIEDRKIYRPANIEVTAGEYEIEIASSTGTSGTITAATITTAGSMSKDDKVKLNALPDPTTLNTSLANKVDKVSGRSLIEDTLITKLTQLRDNTTITSDLAAKVDKETGKGLIEPAPVDGKQYARKGGAWVEVTGGGGGTGDVGEAPIDGKQYARKNATWEEIVAGGGGGPSIAINITLAQYVASVDDKNPPVVEDLQWMASLDEGFYLLYCPEAVNEGIPLSLLVAEYEGMSYYILFAAATPTLASASRVFGVIEGAVVPMSEWEGVHYKIQTYLSPRNIISTIESGVQFKQRNGSAVAGGTAVAGGVFAAFKADALSVYEVKHYSNIIFAGTAGATDETFSVYIPFQSHGSSGMNISWTGCTPTYVWDYTTAPL